jgi:phage gp37-like protein
MYAIETIEDAILTALAPLGIGYTPVGENDPAIWRTVRAIKTYQGELDDEEAVARAARLFPAIVVVYGGAAYANHGARKVETLRFVLFVLDKNVRQEAEARRGGAGNPGCYAILDGARDLLYGKQLGLDILPLEAIREDAVWFGRGVSGYSAEYETGQALLYP